MSVVRGPRTLDFDAALFYEATGITYFQARIVNQLVTDIKDIGIWGGNKLYAVYPIIGGTEQAHKFNLINSADSNSAFRLSFGGGWTHNSTGMTGDGSTGYADTFFIPTTYFSASRYGCAGTYTDGGVGTSNTSIGAVSRYAGGGTLESTRITIEMFDTNNRTYFYAGGGAYGAGSNFYIYSGSNATIGFNAVLYAADSSRISFQNNGTYVEVTSSMNIPSPRISLNLGALVLEDTSRTNFSDQTISFAFCGGVLTTQEMLDFKTAIDDFQYRLNRKVI
jgi:hypothetical protein